MDPGFISSSNVGIAAPGGTTYNAIPVSGFSARRNANAQVIEMYDATRQKNAVVGGAAVVDINASGAFNYEVGLQDVLKYVVGGSWSSNVLLPSDTNNKAAVTCDLGVKIDLDTDDRVLIEDVLWGQFTLNAPLGGPATWSATGLGTTLAVSQDFTGITFNNLAGLSPYAAGLTGSGIAWNAGALTGVESFNLTITNRIQSKFAWGLSTPDHITLGNLAVSGDVQQYYRSSTMLSAAAAETIDDLVVVLGGSEATFNRMTFTFTKAKLNGGGIDTSDTTWVIPFSFNTLYDSTNKSIKMTASTV